MTKYAVIKKKSANKDSAVAYLYNTKKAATDAAKEDSSFSFDEWIVIDFGMGKLVGEYKDGKEVKQ